MAELNDPKDQKKKNGQNTWPEVNEQPAAPYFLGASALPIDGTKVKEEENNTKKKVFVDDDPDHHNSE